MPIVLITCRYKSLLNHPLMSFRAGVEIGGNDFGSFDPDGSGGNPILERTWLTASRTISAVSIRNARRSPFVGCSLTLSHLSRSFSSTLSAIGSPKRTWIFCPIDGKN